ncbi:sensor histidine kinase [Comamonas sp. 26]|uniref:sensor histidine kinase n=1 Tax=Comamonas sp. 26 TaxID=2035201 RepID=UPI000C19B142|nr:sensor histidine kinase [Comamonas sp. 26]PIG08725.1 histidine kinase [Comamonas sp. 26]
MLNSLRARLALWLLLPLAALVAVCAYFSHEHAEEVADYVQDHDLLSSAKNLADRLIWEGSDIHASVPPSALSLFMSPQHDQIYLSVTDDQGQLLAGQPDFPQPTPLSLEGSDAAQWYDASWQGQAIRAVITRRAMFDVAGARPITIIVGKTTHSRDAMLQSLWLPTLEYLLWALALAVLVSATALTLELRPLLAMTQQLAQRQNQPQALQDLDFHLDARPLQQELRPLAETVNQFARTIRAQVARQRQFISDAAHQLRTPLAIQANTLTPDAAQLSQLPSQQQAALWQRLQRSNQQLVNITHQLLLLAQAEQAVASQQAVSVDLQSLCLQALENFAPAAEHKSIDLGWEARHSSDAGTAPYTITAATHLLPELIANLLDNAIRYTPDQGRVTLGLRASEANVALFVEDNGPGIPAQSRDQVFERFYRIATDTQGTGLGLAIVQEVARSCQATISLESGQPMPSEEGRPGLRITVAFHTRPAAT